jgi:DNA-binding GntR family transcriptional regulator
MIGRLLIDECLSPELVQLAIDAGHVESSCVRDRGRLGLKDWELEIISSTAQESETLHVGFGSPLIKLICVITDAGGVPIEHSTALWITSKVRLHF